MKHEDKTNVLNSIKKQFLCNVPLKEFKWKDILSDNLDIQQEIVNNTVDLNLVLKYPTKITYQKAFIKYIISYLEKQGSVIDDRLYEVYGRLVALPSNNSTSYFKHYLIENNEKIISLKENVNIISNGTTGLCTWEASLALSEWILENKQLFYNKSVLELGSGIGLTGLTISLHCSPNNKVYLTDCHSTVLNTLCNNIKLNFNIIDDSKPDVVIINDRCMLDQTINNKCNVQVLNLPWENITTELSKEIGCIDKIIAADVVYDKELFPTLISAVNCLFKNCCVENFILSCTERNKETLEEFLMLLGNEDYEIQEIPVPKQNNFFWSTDIPIRIFSLIR